MISGEVTISDIRVGTHIQVPRIGMEAYIPQAVGPVSVIIALTRRMPVEREIINVYDVFEI